VKPTGQLGPHWLGRIEQRPAWVAAVESEPIGQQPGQQHSFL
jgi:hypothetical protein